MATYAYVCDRGHRFDLRFSIGCAAKNVPCETSDDLGQRCPAVAQRDFMAEFETQSVKSDDPFRRAWLSDDTRVELQKQGRPMDPLAPKDKFEKKHIERETGRIYVGDDISGMSKKAQRAIVNGERKKFAPSNRV